MNLPFSYELDHIGIAVTSLEEGRVFYEALGMKDMVIEEVPSEKVRVGFFELENQVNIELLEPLGEEGPIFNFLKKRGPGVHHICLRVEKLEEIVEELKSKKMDLINDVPKLGAHNCRIVFVHPRSTGGVLLELSEKIVSTVGGS